jgi:uncharacterized protein YecT (DUF1311 family)
MKAYIGMSLILVCLFSGVSSSQNKSAEQDPCKDAMSQPEMNLCARRAFEQADKELNKVYKLLQAELAVYQGDAQEKLKQAQLKWLEYRDANCESEAAVYAGGTIRPTVYNSCLASVTNERTQRLKTFLGEINR